MADAIAVPRSILENHPQRSELFRIRIPALRCFGCRINSRLNGFWALGADSLDESLLVGGVSLRPFESGDQLGMGNRLIHRGFHLLKCHFQRVTLGWSARLQSPAHRAQLAPHPGFIFTAAIWRGNLSTRSVTPSLRPLARLLQSIHRLAICFAFQLAQLLFGSFKLCPERSDFLLQPFNIRRVALINRERLTARLQRRQLVSQLPT